VFAAAPRIILVTGGALNRPAVLADWQENLAIMQAAADPVDARLEDLGSRHSYRVALFWGSEWNRYMQGGRDPGALRPEEANQFARYYPPTAINGAVLAFDAIPGPGAPPLRRLDNQGVAVFARHGIMAEALSARASPGAPAARPSRQSVSPILLTAVFIVLGGAASVGGLRLAWPAVRRRMNP
jgi:hypothetical protein